MQVDILTWKDGARTCAMSKDALSKMEVDAVRNGAPCKTRLDTKEKIAHFFPGSKWESATFRENMTGRDGESASAYQWVNGRLHPERYGKSWALTLLSSWTFVDENDAAIPASEDGWYQLAPDIQDVLAGTMAAWRDGFHLPNSSAPLILSSED